MKMIAADYGDASSGKTERKRLAMSVDLADVEVIASKSFVSEIGGIRPVGPYAGKGTPWMNMHRIVFRPRDDLSRLTISDWTSNKNPGGPIGQQLMFNFVEIQPYFEQ